VIEIRGIDRNGDSRLVTTEAGRAQDLAELVLETGWKYAALTCCGELLAEVTLCSCNGGPPVRQVVITPEH
jgi:hypothetical protein